MAGELVARTVEIYVDGAWQDISDDGLNRDPVTLARGVPDEGGSADPGELGLTLWNGASHVNGTTARYALRNPRSDLYGKIGPNTPIRLSAGLVGSTPTVRTVQEVVSWPPRWDVSGRDRWVPLSASGILRRLGIPSSPLEPALTRAARRDPAVVTHWPLSGLGAGVKRAPSSISGMPGVWIRNGHLADWSSDTSAPGLGACPTIRTAGSDVLVAHGAVPSQVQGRYGLSIWGRGDLDDSLAADLVMTAITDSTYWVLTVEWRASTSDMNVEIQAYDPDADTTLALLSNTNTIAIDAGWHNIAVAINQQGSNADVTVFVDDSEIAMTVDSGSLSGVDIGDLRATDARASLTAGRGLSFGSPAIVLAVGGAVAEVEAALSRLHAAGRGYYAEPAGDRTERLCLEQGISLAGPGADVADDDFGRTETDGWGTAPSGQDWSVDGGDAADYSVSSGQGHIEIDALSSARLATLAVDVADVDIYATVHPNQVFTGAGFAQVQIITRVEDADNHYQFALLFSSTEVSVGIGVRTGGSSTTLALSGSGLSYDASSEVRIRCQTRGNLLRTKFWESADAEPVNWSLEETDGSIVNPGRVGVRALLGSGVTNTLPVTISVSDVVVRTAPTTAPMGPQHPGAFLDVLGECAKLEAAMSRAPILTEQREDSGLRFTPLSSLYGPRTPDLELDYDAAHLAPPFDPTPDDFGQVNDATASRRDGGSAPVEISDGPKGITASGRYDASETFTVVSDEHLPSIARWWTLHGTWDGDRYPGITINMRALSTKTDGAALVAAVQALDPGALVKITNLPEEITEDVEQIVLGITETVSTAEWIVELHTTPAGPFTVGQRGDVGLTGSRKTIVADGEHNAFPGAVQLASGDLLVAWRAAPQHDTVTGTGHGIIYLSRSTDGGINWSTAAAVVDPDPDDGRDPMLSQLDNGDVALTYWTNDGAGAEDAKVVLSDDDGVTWGTPVDIDTGFDVDLSTCPMRDLGGGVYGVALYASTASANWSAIWQPLTSAGAADGSPVTIADGPTDGRNYTEPYVVQLASGDLLCLIRETDGGAIWSSRSTDSGATWSTPTSRFTAIGRPSFVELSDGRLLVVCRRSTTLGVDQAHIIRMSGDDGANWTQEQVLDDESGRSVYAEPVILADGAIGFAYAIENSTTDSEVYWRSGTVVTGNASPSRRDSDSSETAASFVAGTDTSLSVATDPEPLWGVTGDDNMAFPFDIAVDGVRLRVTGISGSSSPQTFTVEQDAVNGISKTIPAGSAVRLWQPATRGLWG